MDDVALGATTHIDVIVEGGTVRVALCGSGPALVLLHGWTLDHRMWAPQLEGLSSACRVIAPDRRGFGASTAPPGLLHEPDDVCRVLDALSVERAVVVGMSQAARVALRLAFFHPDRVAGLVLHGAPDTEGEPEMPLAHYRQLARSGQMDRLREAWGAHPLMQEPDPHATARLALMLADYAGRDLIEPAPAGEDLTPEQMAGITVPALLLTGAFDTDRRKAAAAKLASALSTARHIIPGGGHACNLSNPNAYNAALSGILKDNGTDV